MYHFGKRLQYALTATILAGSVLFSSQAHATLSWTAPQVLNYDGIDTQYQEIPGHMASNGQSTVISASMLQSGEPIISRSADGGLSFTQVLMLQTTIGSKHARVVYNGGESWSAFWRTDASAGEVMYSGDDGITWSQPVSIPWTVVEGNGAGLIMAAMANGVDDAIVSISTTGGSSWAPVGTVDITRPQHLVHVGGSKWLIHGGGALYVSDNDGATWSLGTKPTFTPEELESNHNGIVMAAAQLPLEYNWLMERATSATISQSLDGGVTWGPAGELFTGADEYGPTGYFSGSVYDIHLMYVGKSRWSLVSHLVYREVVPLCCGTFYEKYSRAHLVETNSNGKTWTAPKFIWNGAAGWYSGRKQHTKFYNAGDNLIVSWQQHDGLYQPSGDPRDLYYQTAALPEPPPPGPDNPVDPEEPDMTLANLEGAWAPVAVKEKTKKKTGEVTSKIKGTVLITNTGQTTTEKAIVRFYLSSDTDLDTEVDVELKPKRIGKIKPGKSKSAKAKVKLPGSAAGNYLIGVLDDTDATPEWSESDNTVISPVM